MLAVCQPSVPCYAAAAVKSREPAPARPDDLTMMGGPIDTARRRPRSTRSPRPARTAGSSARHRDRAPFLYPGRGARVYPAFLQLAGFMTDEPGYIPSPATGRCSSILSPADGDERRMPDQGRSTTNIARSAT
jgi:poly-beta-hydroxyalkanoate depolymerase